jgi:predicted secreted protein
MMADPSVTGSPLPDYANLTRVGHTRTKSLSKATETIEGGSDETAPYAAPEPGQRTRSIEGDGLWVYDQDGQAMVEEAEEQQHADALYWLVLIPVEKDGGGSWQERSDAPTYGGKAVITQLDFEGETNSRFEYTLSAEFNGELMRDPSL